MYAIRSYYGHLTEPVGHHVVEVPQRRIQQLLFVERRGLLEAALDDHPVAHPGAPVAGRAEDVEALPTALQTLGGDREGEDARRLSPSYNFV